MVSSTARAECILLDSARRPTHRLGGEWQSVVETTRRAAPYDKEAAGDGQRAAGEASELHLNHFLELPFPFTGERRFGAGVD